MGAHPSELVVIGDIDDVQIPFAETVHQACAKAGLTELDKRWTQWEAWIDYGCTAEEYFGVMASLAIPNGVYHLPPYPGVIEGWQRVIDEGHQLHFVTARGFNQHAQQIRDWTREWVETNFPGWPINLWFAQDKARIAKIIGATHAIDDSMKNVLELRDAGVDTYLMNQPHNTGLQYPNNRRVDSVSEFAERILNG